MGRTVNKAQLESRGELLLGPLVPQWFVDQSDGASVPPGFRRVMRKDKADPPGYVHDFEYFGCAALFEEGERAWDRARMEADQNFKYNIKLIARNRLCGFVFARLYLRAVRIGGGMVMKKHFYELAVPPDLDALEDTRQTLAGMNWGQLTVRADTFLDKWRDIINN